MTNAAMASQQSSASPPLGRRTYQKSLQTLVWRADDENDDELSYEIRYRREGDPVWRVLRTGLSDPILVWDTMTVPNGTYFIKIVASDAPSNAADLALTGEMDSVAFEIDNTAPEVVVQNVRTDSGRTVISLSVTDDHSPIQRVEYSEDGLRWQPVFPADGIADSRTERFEVTLLRAPGPGGLSLRVTDAMNNVTTIQAGAAGR
jgi:hypothetical protein